MKLDRVISADANENTVRERLKAYFVGIGYTQAAAQPNLTYQRGSSLGSLLSFSPKGWKVNAIVQIASSFSQLTQVTVTFDINTTGQLVTESERKFWQNELDDLARAIQTGRVDKSASTKEAQSSLVQNLLAGTVIIGLTIVLASGARLIFDSQTAFYVGGAVGLIFGFLIAQRWLKFRVGGQ